MIVVDGFAGRRVAVLGLARSGRAAAHALAAGGAQVLAWDDNEVVRAAVAGDIPLCDLAAADWREIAAPMLSPGIPHSHPPPHPLVSAAPLAPAQITRALEPLRRAHPRA